MVDEAHPVAPERAYPVLAREQITDVRVGFVHAAEPVLADAVRDRNAAQLRHAERRMGNPDAVPDEDQIGLEAVQRPLHHGDPAGGGARRGEGGQLALAEERELADYSRIRRALVTPERRGEHVDVVLLAEPAHRGGAARLVAAGDYRWKQVADGENPHVHKRERAGALATRSPASSPDVVMQLAYDDSAVCA